MMGKDADPVINPPFTTAPGKAHTGRNFDVASPTRGGHSPKRKIRSFGNAPPIPGWNCTDFTPAGAAVYATQRTTRCQAFPRAH